MTLEQRSKEQLADKANLMDADDKKPLLLQILEKFVSGEVVPGGKVSFDQERDQ